METKCTVCNEGGGHVLCDECGKPVCFSCFHFANSRRLCTSCVTIWETKRRWQTYAETYAKMSADERAGLWATLSPEERLMLEGELNGGQPLRTRDGGVVRRYSWVVFPILACLIVLVLLGDRQLWKQASVASKKLGSEVGSLAGSVRREVIGLTSEKTSAGDPVSPQPPAPIELVSQNLRQSGLQITAANLRMKANPAGEGTIVYSPHYFGPNRRLAWIVIGGQAYSLTATSGDLTPSLQTFRAVPASVWKETGLARDQALSQVEKSIWE